jgi:MFS family permease
MIFVGRIIAGLSIGMLSMVVPLYLGELAPPSIRGSLNALQQLGITVDIMVAFWLDYGTQHIGGNGDGQSQIAWRLPLALQCVPSAILAPGTLFLPHSPRWLMTKGKIKDNHIEKQRVPTYNLGEKRKPEQPSSDFVASQLMTIALSLNCSRSKLQPSSTRKPQLPDSPIQRTSSSSC